MIEKNRLTFNGHDLSSLLTVQMFNKGVSLGRTSVYNGRLGKKGNDFVGHSSTLVTISTPFLFKPEVKNKKEKLAAILNVDEPKILLNSSEPGIYYKAFPTGQIASDETSIFGEGVIVWEIHDGVSHSIADLIFTNKDSLGNRTNFITVNNPGTEPIELELEAIFKSDNGYLGVEGQDDTVKALFGNMTEVDKTPYQRSEKLFDDHMFADRGWVLNNGKVPPVTPAPKQQGTVTYTLEKAPDEGYVKPGSYGTAGSDWTGPSLTKTIPANSEGTFPKQWACDFRLDFNTDGSGTAAPKEVGHQSVTFLDQNNNIIVAVVIEDNNANAKKSDLAIYVRNKRVYDSRNTDKYYVTARPEQNNHIHVEKFGSKIRVGFKAGVKKNNPWLDFTLNEDVELRKITWYAARYKSYPVIRNNLLRAINVVDHKVNKWKDIPNKFKSGDVLRYGRSGESERNLFCTVNDINELRLRDPGSTAISAPPGTTIIYLAYSDFAEIPEVTLKGKASYAI